MSDRHPVVLVHGITDTEAVFQSMSAYLKNQGYSVYSFNLVPNNGSTTLEKLAFQVAEYINNHFDKKEFIDLIGFSMGGLVTRYYLQRLDGIKRVKRYVSISAPNQGTLLAYLLPFEGIREMQFNSPFLEDLNRDAEAILNKIKVKVIWTPLDLMIIPAHSSRLPVGSEENFPVLIHRWMLSDYRVLQSVVKALKEPLD